MTALARLETDAAMPPAARLWTADDLVSYLLEAKRVARASGAPVEPDDLFQITLKARRHGHFVHKVGQQVFHPLDPEGRPVVARSAGQPSASGAQARIESSESARLRMSVRAIISIGYWSGSERQTDQSDRRTR